MVVDISKTVVVNLVMDEMEAKALLRILEEYSSFKSGDLLTQTAKESAYTLRSKLEAEGCG